MKYVQPQCPSTTLVDHWPVRSAVHRLCTHSAMPPPLFTSTGGGVFGQIRLQLISHVLWRQSVEMGQSSGCEVGCNLNLLSLHYQSFILLRSLCTPILLFWALLASILFACFLAAFVVAV